MKNLPLGKSTESPVAFKAGTVIFHEGEEAKYLCLVKKGQLHLLKNNGQHLHITKLCKEKDILNEVSVLTRKPNECSAIAKTDVELVLVEQKDILSVIKNSDPWVSDMFETLCERLKSTQDIIDEHNLMAGEKNADTVLSKDDEKRYLNALAEYKSR